MQPRHGTDHDEFDVIVAGSGGPGLTAALRAADAGLSVAVLEKSARIGGTTAVSGGTLWVPASGPMRAAGAEDDPDEALTYLRAVTRGTQPDELLRAIVDSGPDMIDFLAAHGLRFTSVTNYPDYRQDLPGASRGGRSLDPQLFDTTAMSDVVRDAVRTDPRLPFTMEEYEQWGAFTHFPWDELQRRKNAGIAARGGAIVYSLTAALSGLGATMWTHAAVSRLERDSSGAVEGVWVHDRLIRARRGVILATGGFEWNDRMLREFISAPFAARCSPPHNTGDGIIAGAQIGARLRNMHEAWWAPYAQLPDEQTDGSPTASLLRFERQGPGSIIVNKEGRRFVNEAQNYNDLTRAMHAYQPRDHASANLPAWVVVDSDYMRRYGLFGFRQGDAIPDWLSSGESVADLATAIGVPPEELERTIDRFNGFAEQGTDADFRRGESAYDRYWGDKSRGLANPSLAPLTEGPFFAFPALPGGFGTCGGLATDENAQVLTWNDEAIPGLFAVGNTSAHPVGGGYPGAGATLGPAMTMAFRAGGALVTNGA